MVYSNFSTTFTHWRSGIFWKFWHLNGFGMYISTSVIMYPIFISVRGLGVLKLRIYVFVRIVWLLFLMDIHWASVTTCLQWLVFILSRVQRERSGLLATLFDDFGELWG